MDEEEGEEVSEEVVRPQASKQPGVVVVPMLAKARSSQPVVADPEESSDANSALTEQSADEDEELVLSDC